MNLNLQIELIFDGNSSWNYSRFFKVIIFEEEYGKTAKQKAFIKFSKRVLIINIKAGSKLRHYDSNINQY